MTNYHGFTFNGFTILKLASDHFDVWRVKSWCLDKQASSQKVPQPRHIRVVSGLPGRLRHPGLRHFLAGSPTCQVRPCRAPGREQATSSRVTTKLRLVGSQEATAKGKAAAAEGYDDLHDNEGTLRRLAASPSHSPASGQGSIISLLFSDTREGIRVLRTNHPIPEGCHGISDEPPWLSSHTFLPGDHRAFKGPSTTSPQQAPRNTEALPFLRSSAP